MLNKMSQETQKMLLIETHPHSAVAVVPALNLPVKSPYKTFTALNEGNVSRDGIHFLCYEIQTALPLVGRCQRNQTMSFLNLVWVG